MSIETSINQRFSDEKIRLTVLENICRMMITRGYMDKDKYSFPEVNNNSNPYNLIDNTKFMSFIGSYVDNNTYLIPIDNHYRDEREVSGDGANHEFDGSVLVVRLIPQIVKDITNSPILNDFFKTYTNHHKIVVFDGISDKVYNSFRKKKNSEVFDRDFLMIDLMSMTCAPNNCKFVSKDEISHIINPKFSKMHENDPCARYYNAKVGSILRIERPSINNSCDIGYRKIIEPKSIFY